MSKFKIAAVCLLILAAAALTLFLNFEPDRDDTYNIGLPPVTTIPATAPPAATAPEPSPATTAAPELSAATAAPAPTTQAPEEGPRREIRPLVKARRRVYRPEFDALRAHYNNSDIIGIIRIPGTVIFYPVAHYAGNNEFYLRHNLHGRRTDAASIFMDYQNDAARRDPSTIIYGHRMIRNWKFHSVGFFADQAFFEGHRYIIFNTIYENNIWEVFAFLETHISFNYITVNFAHEREFLALAREIKNRAMHSTGAEIGPGDRILILSTCTPCPDRDMRHVLVARLVRDAGRHVPEHVLDMMRYAVHDYLAR